MSLKTLPSNLPGSSGLFSISSPYSLLGLAINAALLFTTVRGQHVDFTVHEQADPIGLSITSPPGDCKFLCLNTVGDTVGPLTQR